MVPKNRKSMIFAVRQAYYLDTRSLSKPFFMMKISSIAVVYFIALLFWLLMCQHSRRKLFITLLMLIVLPQAQLLKLSFQCSSHPRSAQCIWPSKPIERPDFFCWEVFIHHVAYKKKPLTKNIVSGWFSSSSSWTWTKGPLINSQML